MANGPHGSASLTTRSTIVPPPTTEELEESNPVKDFDEARASLEKKQLLVPNETISPTILSHILLQMALDVEKSSKKQYVIETLRSVAVLMKAMEAHRDTDIMIQVFEQRTRDFWTTMAPGYIEHLKDSLVDAKNEAMADSANTLEGYEHAIKQHTENLRNLVGMAEEEVTGGEEEGEQRGRRNVALRAEVERLEGKIDQLSTTCHKLEQLITASGSASKTYVNAASNGAQIAGDRAQTRMTTRSNNDEELIDKDYIQHMCDRLRQIQLEIDSNTFAGLNNKDIKQRATETLRLMHLEAEDRPEDFEFVNARVLRSGRIMLEVNTMNAAEWIKQPDVMNSFLQHFCFGARFKDTGYPILAENVPVEFQGHEGALRFVEKANQLPEGEILSTRWPKNPSRRVQDQRTAHLMLTLKHPESANNHIDNGILLAAKVCQVRKFWIEPTRCAKCQRFTSTHTAATCKNVMDVCGTCADTHRTTDCLIKDRAQYKCVNCKANGHAAWDRQCPKYIQQKDRQEKLDPHNSFQYYPTSDPKTWVQVRGVSDTVRRKLAHAHSMAPPMPTWYDPKNPFIPARRHLLNHNGNASHTNESLADIVERQQRTLINTVPDREFPALRNTPKSSWADQVEEEQQDTHSNTGEHHHENSDIEPDTNHRHSVADDNEEGPPQTQYTRSPFTPSPRILVMDTQPTQTRNRYSELEDLPEEDDNNLQLSQELRKKRLGAEVTTTGKSTQVTRRKGVTNVQDKTATMKQATLSLTQSTTDLTPDSTQPSTSLSINTTVLAAQNKRTTAKKS